MADIAPNPVTVVIRPSGSIHVIGPVIIQDAEGNVIVPPTAKTPGTVKFCGCGASLTRPFCDGSHKTLKTEGT